MFRTIAAALSSLSAAAAGAELPPDVGDICTRAWVEERMPFERLVGDLPLERAVGLDGTIGCDFAPPLDPDKPAWVRFDVPKVSRHIRAHVKIEAERAHLAPGVEVVVLAIGRNEPDAPSSVVLLGLDDLGYYVRIGWFSHVVKRGPRSHIKGVDDVLTLVVDRGANGETVQQPDSIRLLLDQVEVSHLIGGVTDDVLPPAAGESGTSVWFGLLEGLEGGAAVSGHLVFRPLGVETGWGSPQK